MSKETIARWWISGAGLLGVAAILLVGGGVALLARLDLPAEGEVGLGDAEARALVALVVFGGAVAAVGVVAELVAWIGALANTYPLANRRWFAALAWSGVAGIVTLPLFGLGAAIGGSAMLAYLVGGPAEGMTRSTTWPKARIVRLSSAGLIPMAVAFAGSLLVARLTTPSGVLHGQQPLAVGFLAASVALAVAGVVAEVAAWWAALFNARRLVDQTWFRVLLATGIAAALTMPVLGLGAFIAIATGIAYPLAAPDSTAAYDSFPPDAASGGGRMTPEVIRMASSEQSSSTVTTARSTARALGLRDIPATAWTTVGAVLAVVFAGPILLVAGLAAAAAMWLEQQVRPDHHADLVAWTRHLAEMVLAMYAGMLAYHAVARPVIAALAGSGPFEGDLGYAWMVLSMVLPMAGLMFRQGHGARMTAEMSFAMVAPTVLCFALVRLGIAPFAPFLAWLTPTTVYAAAHAAMIIGMVAATYLRRAMYGRGHIPESGTHGPIGSAVVPASGW